MKGIRHPSRGANDLGIAGRRGQTDQNMLPRVVIRFLRWLFIPLRRLVDPFCRAQERDFPEGHQIGFRKEMGKRLPRLLLLIDLPLT